MERIVLNRALCVRCGQCTLVCPNHILQRKTNSDYPSSTNGAEENCIECHHCIAACPGGALSVNGIGCEDCLENDKTITIRFENVAHLVRNRRSIRRYSDKPLDDQVIEQLLNVTRWAPSARNGLPIKWVIVNNADKVRELAGLVMEEFKTMPNAERMVADWDSGGDPVFRGAPCVVGAYTDDLTAHWSALDAAIAVETLDLCAAAKRLGACWAGLFVRAAQASQKSPINKWLGLSNTETIHAGLMIGHIGEEVYQRIPHRPEASKIWIR